MIALSPLLWGACQETKAEALPAIAVTLVGLPGTPRTWSVEQAVPALVLPAEFVARTQTA